MKFKYTYRILSIMALALFIYGCVEPFEYETGDFESALVIEATITNTDEKQMILLSRTYALEENGPLPETGAMVSVIADSGLEYEFVEAGPGRYVSRYAFAAEEGMDYRLDITTAQGGVYTSEPAGFTGESQIDDIYARPEVNLEGDNGVEILLDSRGSPDGSGYYRYEYVETYKFVSPFFKSEDIVPFEGYIALVPKSKEEYTCFRTHTSQEIILNNTTTQASDRATGIFLRFIPRRDPTLSQRYSILVKQFGISREAFAFYQSLKELSESESLFSQVQPGFLAGNIFSVTNPNENVLGFFSVSSVAEKRVYFNYDDFYTALDGPRPNFNNYCPLISPNSNEALLEYTNDPFLVLFEDKDPRQPRTPNDSPLRYVFTRAACVDCTLTGSNEVPEFWED